MVEIKYVDDKEKDFVEYLLLSNLGPRTVKEYQICYRNFPKDMPLNEKLIWNYLNLHSGNIARAFVKIYLQYKKVKNVDIPRIRGAKRKRLNTLLTKSEYEILRRALYLRNIKYGLMFDVSYWCALRRAEICAMEPSWIVLEEYQEGRPLRIKVIGKRDKERIAVVPASVAALLVKYIIDQFNALKLGNKDPIFQTGVHYWWEVITQVSEKALGRRIKPHNLRHTRATTWYKDGVDLIKIKERLGHTNLSTTERYTQITPEEVAQDWESELSD